MDGTTVRGSRAGDRRAVHVLAAMLAGSRAVVAQREIAAKTTESTAFAPLLEGQDLTGMLVSADALPPQRAHARFWSRTKTPTTYSWSRRTSPAGTPHSTPCPGDEVPLAHMEHDRGHGRTERRTLQVLPAPDSLDFPHAAQAFLAERYVAGLHGTPISAVAVLGLTSRTAERANPAQIATALREQWAIENGLHYFRDVTFAEDTSRIRTSSGPRIMTSLPRDRRAPPRRLPQHRRRPTLGQLQLHPVALQNGFTGPDLARSARHRLRHDHARVCADALPARLPRLRVAGAVGAIFCCQGRRDTACTREYALLLGR